MTATRGDDGHVSLSRVATALAVLDKGLLNGLTLALSEVDSSVEQWRILDLISQLGAPTMGELAASSGLPNASLSRVVDGLEDAASVYRLPSPEDRRRLTVRLSDHGAERHRMMNSIVEAWERSTQAWLGAEAVAAMESAVRLVEQRLNKRPKQPAR